MVNIIKKIKENGLLWFFKAIFYAIFRKYTTFVLKKDLNSIEIVNAKIDLKYKHVEESIISTFMKKRELFNKDDVSTFFKNGARCLGAFAGDRLVGYTWAHFDGYYFPLFKYFLIVHENETFIGPDWVDPEFRGNMIHSALLSQIFSDLKKEGYLFAYGNVMTNNIASIKGLKKVGFEPIFKITVMKLFGKIIIYKKKSKIDKYY